MAHDDSLEFLVEKHSAPVPAEERTRVLMDPGFGKLFTGHMVTNRYSEDKGWHDARVQARAPIPMDPASTVLHYAQDIFEGMKANRPAAGTTASLRPELQAVRVSAS